MTSQAAILTYSVKTTSLITQESPNVMQEWAVLLLRAREILVYISPRHTTVLTEVIRGFYAPP
jgi:hypothetical protein